jgi:hypothetical protein
MQREEEAVSGGCHLISLALFRQRIDGIDISAIAAH